MPAETQPARLLVWVTIGVLIVISALVIYTSQKQQGSPTPLNIKGQPTVGSLAARVHVVSFEEPKCINCKIYNHNVYPKIKKAFIDTNMSSYTVISCSFLPHSMLAAVALLCVYNTNPSYPDSQLFFT